MRLRFATFEDWWHPFTLGVGPAGDYVAGRSPAARETLLRALRTELGAGPLELEASAWFLLGRVLAAGAGESGSFPG